MILFEVGIWRVAGVTGTSNEMLDVGRHLLGRECHKCQHWAGTNHDLHTLGYCKNLVPFIDPRNLMYIGRAIIHSEARAPGGAVRDIWWREGRSLGVYKRHNEALNREHGVTWNIKGNSAGIFHLVKLCTMMITRGKYRFKLQPGQIWTHRRASRL